MTNSLMQSSGNVTGTGPRHSNPVRTHHLLPHLKKVVPHHLTVYLVTGHVQRDIIDVAVWAGAIAPLIFLVVYTRRCDWYSNPAGRSIVALDILLMAISLPSALLRAFPGLVFGSWYQWITVIALSMVPVVVIYRTISLVRHKD
jgi:hypothetical protein